MLRRQTIMFRSLFLVLPWLVGATPELSAETSKPNIVLLFCDNLGYGDVGCFGSKKHRTPQIDQMAAEGIRLTSFYSASGVCTPSRAALMTGCYPRRVGLHKTDPDGAVLREDEFCLYVTLGIVVAFVLLMVVVAWIGGL